MRRSLRCSRSSRCSRLRDLPADQSRRPSQVAPRGRSRSLTMTNLKSWPGRTDARSIRATKTIVSDLPEPCVCQTHRSLLGGLAGAQPLDDPSCRPVLLVAAYHFHPPPESVSMKTAQVRSMSSSVSAGGSNPGRCSPARAPLQVEEHSSVGSRARCLSKHRNARDRK